MNEKSHKSVSKTLFYSKNYHTLSEENNSNHNEKLIELECAQRAYGQRIFIKTGYMHEKGRWSRQERDDNDDDDESYSIVSSAIH